MVGRDASHVSAIRQGLCRAGVIALDLPPDVAAGAVRAMGVGVVVAVPGSAWSELNSLRRGLARGELDAVVAYSSDRARQAYPSIYEAGITLALRGHSWLLADGNTQALLRIGAIDSISTMSQLASGSVQACREVLAARREMRGPPAAYAEAAAPYRVVGDPWALVVWRGSTATEGGAITHLRGVLSGLHAHGFRTALVTAYRPPTGIEGCVDEFVLTDPLPPSRRFTRDTERLAVDRQLTEACRELAKRLCPRFIYQRHAYLSMAGLIVAKQMRVPFVLEWNFSEVWDRRNWSRPDPLKLFSKTFEELAEVRETKILVSSSAVAAVSKVAGQMAVASGASSELVITVPNAVNLHDVPAPGAFPDHAPAILLGWVGTFGPWHGAEVAVKALAHIPRPARLVMIGDGLHRPDCERLAVALGVSDRVDFVGTVPRTEVMARLQKCDVLLSPHVPLDDTPFFGSPTKIFEYMAVGRPIVASRLGQIAEILTDGRTARLVEPGDDVDLAKGILDVINSRDRGAELGRAARQEAAEYHSWADRVGRILQALDLRGRPLP